ncbi:unnamed protein product, partial [Owenia fusiformis]
LVAQCLILAIYTLKEAWVQGDQPCFNLMLVFDVSCERDAKALNKAVGIAQFIISQLNAEQSGRERTGPALKVGVVAFDKDAKVYFKMEFYDENADIYGQIIKEINPRKNKCKPKTDVALRSLYEDHMQ